MREQRQSPSLLSYLATGKGGAGLKIALLSDDAATLAEHAFPFLLAADADPLTRLIRAAFVTDAGSRIKDVFLLVQRDLYTLSPNQLAPLTNTDVEGIWQRTHEYHHPQDGDSPLITLQQQLDKQGKLVPLQSLFFCKSTGRYFHPPCPSCGTSLQLCLNDHLLASLDLPQYTRSLSRYLFCPTCFSSNRGLDFYTFRKDAPDPPLVKDCSELIRAFKQLVLESSEGSGLPCVECAEKDSCFGPAASAPPPIVPFSFYPFNMLIYEAMPINGLDFVAIVAGASSEAAAEREGFLFAEDARFFLEVLYLKLSFLDQIVTELFPGSDKSQPDPLLYVDRIWVRLVDRPGLLPYLWNFELNYIDLVRDPLDLPAHLPMPPAYALHLLGLIWFTLLLVNSQQDVSQVHQAVAHVLDRMPPDGPVMPDNLTEQPAFDPANVFWDPVPVELTEDWSTFWEEALRIGRSLFQASLQGRSQDFRENLLGTIEQLRAAIKREMFSADVAGKVLDRSREAETIHGVLSRMAAKWRQQLEVQPGGEWEKTVVVTSVADFEATLPLGAASVPEDASQTVVLGAAEAREPDAAPADEAIYQETVILSGKGVSEALRKDEAPVRKVSEELPETVILGAARTTAGHDATLAPAPSRASGERAGGAVQHGGELAETVILAPSPRAAAREVTPAISEAPPPAPAPQEEEVPETVILSPARGPRTPPPPRGPSQQVVPEQNWQRPVIPPSEGERPEAMTEKKPKPGEDDDLLSATIILPPSKDRGKK